MVALGCGAPRDLGSTWEKVSGAAPGIWASTYPSAMTERFNPVARAWSTIVRSNSSDLLFSVDDGKHWSLATFPDSGRLTLERLAAADPSSAMVYGLRADGQAIRGIDLSRRCTQDLLVRLPAAPLRELAVSRSPSGQVFLYALSDFQVYELGHARPHVDDVVDDVAAGSRRDVDRGRA